MIEPNEGAATIWRDRTVSRCLDKVVLRMAWCRRALEAQHGADVTSSSRAAAANFEAVDPECASRLYPMWPADADPRRHIERVCLWWSNAVLVFDGLT